AIAGVSPGGAPRLRCRSAAQPRQKRDGGVMEFRQLARRCLSLMSGWLPLACAVLVSAETVFRGGAHVWRSTFEAVAACGVLLVARTVSQRVSRSGPLTERVLILGTGPLAGAVAKEVEEHGGPYVIAGIVEETAGSGCVPDGVTRLGA